MSRLVDRVSPTDMVSLASDTVAAPMQVGAVIVLAAGRLSDLAAIESTIAERIQAIPRLRQRLVRVPLGYGRPIWVDDAKFDIARHLRRMACPLPGDEQALLQLTATLVTRPLPRSRPLWSATLVSGLAGNRTALVFVFHHVLTDGIGGLAVLASLVDGAAAAGPMPFPAGGPSRRELALDAWTTRLHAASRLPQFAVTARHALAELAAKPAMAQSCSLNEPTGPRRHLAVVQTDLARIHVGRARRAHQHTRDVDSGVGPPIGHPGRTRQQHRSHAGRCSLNRRCAMALVSDRHDPQGAQ
jgi:diacylglycerol O-acyltransferase